VTVFRFESKEQREDRELQELADIIANDAVKRLNYEPDKDPVLARFCKKMGLPHPQKK
jgi:hypothetical protein